ncbi:alpha/beta hydrolase [Actinacidiphila paucisporea]|uniref:Acetyl esterase/lipase n=1 Tax=Actinacidiphila paucisporea TaxID=310782 RepID=A0A1M7CRT3_9ACTN|nr:alpha/beta hydrolase [Actinacidiphila paucisporea]SHL69974.1 Acetyl esterase/lipase [Actinacidiphila paucisporea]
MAGALSTALLLALCALLALRPPRPRHSTMGNPQFALGFLVNEQPYLYLWWLLLSTSTVLADRDLDSPAWWLVTSLSAFTVLELALIAARARSARPALSAALEDAFGPGAAPRYTRPPWWRIVLLPLISWRPDVRRIRNRRYGPARRGHRLDVYVSRRVRRTDAPVMVYLHGGGFRTGSKMLGCRSLIYRLAAEGWVCVSADYRLLRTPYAEQLADARAAIGWARANAPTYGGSSDTVFLVGGSAGAHLAATAALSGTEVTGVVGLYGYYGEAGPDSASPHACANPDAPPFLIVHGALDTLVLREDARSFATRLRATSRRPVAYAELPGTQHSFDQFPSVRFHAVTDAVLRFAHLTTKPAS